MRTPVDSGRGKGPCKLLLFSLFQSVLRTFSVGDAYGTYKLSQNVIWVGTNRPTQVWLPGFVFALSFMLWWWDQWATHFESTSYYSARP